MLMVFGNAAFEGRRECREENGSDLVVGDEVRARRCGSSVIERAMAAKMGQ